MYLNKRQLLGPSLAMLGLTACAPPNLSSSVNESAALQVFPRFNSGGLTTQGAGNPFTPYTSASVDHLILQIFKVSGGVETAVMNGASAVQVDLASSSLTAAPVFHCLHAQTTYRVRAYAYGAPGTDASHLISVSASSSVDLVVTSHALPTLGTLTVQLKDKVFNGQTSPTVPNFSNGNVIYTGTPSIGFTSAT